MNPIPVSARRLCQRNLRCLRSVIRGGTLFPLFDRGGRVKWIMTLIPESPEIYLARWRPGMFRVPLRGSIRCPAAPAWLRSIRQADLESLQPLLHFDPWWLLKKAPYVSHTATPALKATNCAAKFRRSAPMVYFRRDLSRVCWIKTVVKGKTTFARWAPDLLKPPPSPPDPPAPEGTEAMWRFDPIWWRWTAG